MQAERFAVIGYQQQRRRGDVFIASLPWWLARLLRYSYGGRGNPCFSRVARSTHVILGP